MQHRSKVGVSSWGLRGAWAALLWFSVGCNREEQRHSPEPGPQVSVQRAALVTTVALAATGDAYLKQGSPNQNQGGDTVLSIQQSGKRRALLFFDSGAIAAAVGDGTLVSAHLELGIIETGNNWGSGRPISLHRLKQASAEYQATWNCALDANPNNQQPDCSDDTAWEMAASDPAAQPWFSPATASAVIAGGLTGQLSLDVTADVAAILTGGWAGHGWLLKKDDEGQNGSIELAALESGAAPRLLLQVDGVTGGGGPGPVTGSAVLFATRDTHVRQGQPNQNYGTESFLRIQASGRNRALVGFDAGAIPTTLQGGLVAATLTLPIQTTYDNWGPDRAVGAYRLLQSFDELGATWNCALDSNPANSAPDCAGSTAWTLWGTGEPPFLIAPTGTALVANGQTGTLEIDVTRDVACALSGHAPAHGWLVKKAMESQNGKIELASRESATPPALRLDWTDGAGIQVSAADCGVADPPGGCTPFAPLDTTCDGLDDDCDGSIDDDFEVSETTCGTEGCAATGTRSCIAGTVQDDCTYSTPDDENPCTTDSCDPSGTPLYAPLPAGTACGDQDVCNGDELCNGAGVCQPGTPPVIEDGNPCTSDSCDPQNGALHQPVAVGTSCSDGNVCNGDELCNGAGVCQPGTPPEIEDGNPCTSDSCDPTSGLSHVPVAQGTSCTDGNLCNGVEACDSGGSCVSGAPPAIDDGLACTQDVCDPATGEVSHPFAVEGTPCGPNTACDGAGACLGPPPILDPPPLDETGSTSFIDSVAFLFTGDAPAQSGVAAGTISEERVALLNGRVVDVNGAPLENARVIVAGSPELGETYTRANGEFDMVVNGGMPLTVRIQKAGFLSADRVLYASWESAAGLGDVVLVSRDPVASSIVLANPEPQVARGSVTTDEEGSRQAVLLVPPDTRALMELPDGTVTELETMTLRLTEHTVGATASLAMPAELPPTTALTYAVDISADEAVAAGAVRVDLDRPLAFYLENFLGFPVGEIVPSGYYDRGKQAWVASENGVVLQLVEIAAGLAGLDWTGDGVAETATVLRPGGGAPVLGDRGIENREADREVHPASRGKRQHHTEPERNQRPQQRAR